MNAETIIAGLDIGTTGCKCTVFDTEGKRLAKAYRTYELTEPCEAQETDAGAIMDAVYAVLHEAAEQYPEISGIGVTSFGETFVMTDAAGQPLHGAMLYTDPRGREQCRQLSEEIGDERICEITGLRPHEMYSLPKMMWLLQNRPEVYERASFIFLMEDFVVYHLTGTRQIDDSLATRTMAFDVQKLDWSREILIKAGIDRDRLSHPVRTGTDAGCVTQETADRTGLSVHTHIISVSHDQVAAAVGAGAFDASVAVDGAGTVECITPVYDHLPDMKVMYRDYFAVVPYVFPGKYVAYAFSYTGGALLQWCTQKLARGEKETAEKEGISVNALLEQKYLKEHGNKPGTLLVLPHFACAATPYMDTGSRGVITGLTLESSVSDIYRGCMEGIVYEMLVNMKGLESSGCRFEKMNATGGGARSEIWMQMKADILNLPVTALEETDAGTAGCAMITGTAMGYYRDLTEAYQHMVHERKTFRPDKEMHRKYMQVYARYEKMYQAVRPLME
ncbi:MAG: carbohydrate kinase [Butyrivibrio sp.]|jgi:xylulokinase|nr:carbohydrate kinase [Butyrivibrio sp.]